MHANLICIIFAFLAGIDFTGLFILITIFAIPCFFIFRVFYKKRFKDNKAKVVTWAIVSSLLMAPILVVILFALIIFGFFIYEN